MYNTLDIKQEATEATIMKDMLNDFSLITMITLLRIEANRQKDGKHFLKQFVSKWHSEYKERLVLENNKMKDLLEKDSKSSFISSEGFKIDLNEMQKETLKKLEETNKLIKSLLQIEK